MDLNQRGESLSGDVTECWKEYEHDMYSVNEEERGGVILQEGVRCRIWMTSYCSTGHRIHTERVVGRVGVYF